MTLELRNEIRLMRQHHACTTVFLVIGATVYRQVTATRNVDSLIDEIDLPKWVVGKARLEAFSVGFYPNS